MFQKVVRKYAQWRGLLEMKSVWHVIGLRGLGLKGCGWDELNYGSLAGRRAGDGGGVRIPRASDHCDQKKIAKHL